MRTNILLKRLLTLGLGLVLGTGFLSAQNITVKGQVLDTEKQPVIGAAVIQAGTTNGASTDIDGNFTLTVPLNADLEVSAIGYEKLSVKASSSTLEITLREESTLLDETVVVGYGVQKKASLTSSISQVNAEDIVSTKQSSLVSSLQGKVPGLQIRQANGQPGSFDTDLSMRGYGEPLVIIDGVRRTSFRGSRYAQTWGGFGSSSAALAELNPEDIESITVLKDASASIYGMGAQNGVILVTTKKGQIGKPSINYSSTFSFGVPQGLPEMVDIVTLMQVENEMRVNSHMSPKYSDETIQHYINGDPGYTRTDWYKEIMKSNTFNMVHNLSLRGGNQSTRYFLSANYTDDNSIFKTDNANYHRYGFTGNVTSNLTENLSVTYMTSLNIAKRKNPSPNTQMNVFYYALLADPTIPATVYGNPTHYTDQPTAENRNPLALLDPEIGGYANMNTVTMRNNLDFNYQAPWLKGLTLTLSGAYDFTFNQTNTLTRTFDLYDYWTDELANTNPDENGYDESWSRRQNYYARAQANYNTTIARNHHLTATVAAEMNIASNANISGSGKYGDFFTHDVLSTSLMDSSTMTTSGGRSQSASAGYIGRVNYDYKGKYLVELMGRYDGSYLYAPGYRWGFFPSYSVGWRVSEEPFFKRILPQVNNFKLRWSDGHVSSAQGSAYAWQLGYSASGSWVFDDGSANTGYVSHSVAETLLSWVDNRMMDFGIDWEVKQGLFGGSIDWFWRERSGIAAQASVTVPDFYGLSLPYQNLNKSENVGIDLVLTHRYHIGKFNYRLQGTATFSRSRTTYQESDETATYTSAYNYWQNHSTGRWGNAHSSTTYHWMAGNPQFTSWSDIANNPVLYDMSQSSSQMLPGMYYLEDRNGDGVLSMADMYYTWPESNPPLQFGLTFSGRYENFDINVNFTGATLSNKSVSLSGGMGYGFFSGVYTNYLDRYHLADGYTDPFDPQSQWIAGYWPALAKATSAYDGTSNTTYRYNQPYNFVNATFLRLKSMEIGYTLPETASRFLHLRSVRIFANGTNLLTFCNKLLKPYDPELNQGNWLGVGGYPLMRTFSVGLNVNF